MKYMIICSYKLYNNYHKHRLIEIICLSFSTLAARNHVNRMCLAADIPLLESGTAGYLGQVTVIKKVNGSRRNERNLT